MFMTCMIRKASRSNDRNAFRHSLFAFLVRARCCMQSLATAVDNMQRLNRNMQELVEVVRICSQSCHSHHPIAHARRIRLTLTLPSRCNCSHLCRAGQGQATAPGAQKLGDFVQRLASPDASMKEN